MKNLVEKIEEYDNLERELRKIASKIHAGHEVDAWRATNALIAAVGRAKKGMIEESERAHHNEE